jgi:hypothetical protein
VESESESDEEARVVRTAKEKRWEALLKVIGIIRNHLKISDWVSLQEDFDNLNKALERAAAVIAKEGVPRFYIRSLVELEDAVAALGRAEVRTMSQANAKAFTRVKMNLKKNNTKYTDAIAAFRANPDVGPAEPTPASGARGGAGAGRRGSTSSEEEEEVVIGREFSAVRRGAVLIVVSLWIVSGVPCGSHHRIRRREPATTVAFRTPPSGRCSPSGTIPHPRPRSRSHRRAQAPV